MPQPITLCKITGMIKPKTKAFADKLLNDPKITQQDAYLQTHKTTHKPTARVQASILLNKPDVLAYMEQKAPLAEKTIVQVMKNANTKDNKKSVQWQRLAHDSAQTILDRTYGKAITRSNNVNVNVSIEEALNQLS